MENNIHQIDATQLLRKLKTRGVKSPLIIIDPPYGTTNLELDKDPPNFPKLAKTLLSVLEPNGWLFLFGTVEMAKVFLDYYNLKFYYVWKKPNFAPMSPTTVRPGMVTELIFAFYRPDLKKVSQLAYNPDELRTTGHEPYRKSAKTKITEFTEAQGCFGSYKEFYAGDDTRKGTNLLEYPDPTIDGVDLVMPPDGMNLLEFPNKPAMPLPERTDHPTQKPVELLKLLVKGYSKPNDLVLDCYAGSGTTLVAAKQLNRRYIGSEINPKYVKVCQDRLAKVNVINQ